MTTVTKTPTTFLNAVSGAAGSTKAAPGANSTWIDTGSGTSGTPDGGDMGLSIQNGSAAPGAAGQIQIQWSPDNGATVYDYGPPMGGDTVASSLYTTTIWIDPGLRYLRVIGYGNTTNPVTYGASFSGVTRA